MDSPAPNIPRRHRPIFDGLDTDEAKGEAAMKEYNLLKDADENGMAFAHKTSQWIAFERHVESQREDRLFHDPLAQHFMQPYGQRLSDSMSLGMRYGVFDPPGADIGLGLEGHVMYTAARTKLINNHVEEWIIGDRSGNGQVVNVGAGMDTRPYWLECLSQAKAYWEIDAPSVTKYKQGILEGLKEKEELPPSLCPIKSIAMDFGEESIADLPSKHDFEKSIPSCWILEGLIMYLQRADVEQLMDTISTLSATGSYIILNFSTNMPHTTSPTIDELDTRLEGKGWKKVCRLMFGEEGFRFNRYPEGKPANKMLGFAMYQKE